MKVQLPTLSSAPPVSACPLVQPRASTAPTPITVPPAKAIARRDDAVTPRPRVTTHQVVPVFREERGLSPFLAWRPASIAEAKPPIATPTISISSHSCHGPPSRERYRSKYGFARA